MTQTIIIVDDHPSFRATARRLLELEGFAVLGEAPDGETAIDEVLRLGPDIVLLDVSLPDLDGFQVRPRPSRHRRLRGRAAAQRARPPQRYRPHLEPGRRGLRHARRRLARARLRAEGRALG